MAYPDQRYWRPASGQPYGTAPSDGSPFGGPSHGGPSPGPGSGPGPQLIVGLALLLCSAACLGLLFFPPARLLALLLVLPVGASVLYVWFRDRARTNAALTVGALAIVSIALGLGVAMLVSDHQSPAPKPRVPLTPTSGEPALIAPAQAPAPPTKATRPTPAVPPKASHAPAPAAAPAVTKHPAATASKPATRDHETPAMRSPEPGRTGQHPDSDDDRRHSDRGRDTDRDLDSDRPSEEPAEPRSCNFGDVRINPDGTGDVCADSDGEGGYTWRRNQHIPD